MNTFRRGCLRAATLPVILVTAVPVLIGLVALPRLAAADCAGPQVALSHPSGATLPPDPVVFAFLPAAEKTEIRVRSGKKKVPAKVTEVSRSKAFTAYRVAVSSGKRTSVTVEVKSRWQSTSATYRIDRSWRKPEVENRGVLSAVRRSDAWTCSFTDEYQLSIAPSAPAYRVEWATSRAEFDRGERGRSLFPRRMDRFWRYIGDGARPEAPGEVTLGHANCFDWTVPKAVIDTCFYVGVTALYPDGSELAVTAEPLAIGCARADNLSGDPRAR